MRAIRVATGYGETVLVRTAKFDEGGEDVMVEAEFAEFAITPTRARRLAAAIVRTADAIDRKRAKRRAK